MDGEELRAFTIGFDHDFSNGATEAEKTAFTRGWKWGLAWLSSELMKAEALNQTAVMQIEVDP